MKKLIIAIICLLPFSGKAQEKYVLRGNIADQVDSGVVYLRYNSESGLKVDSSLLVNGRFTLSAPLSSITEGYLSIVQRDKIANQIKIYLEPLEMRITSSTHFLKDAVITGSPVNDENKIFLTTLKPITDKSDAQMKKWRSTPDNERMDTTFRRDFNAQQLSIELEARKLKKEFALTRFNSYIGFIAYLESGSMDFTNNFEGFALDFNQFSAQVRATDLGRSLQEQIDGALKTRIGLKAMDFMQSDVNGKPVRLSDFRGKYVLLDFWASWCRPCREETPALVKVYAHFKDKKFSILSVSLDKAKEKESWLKAIKNDGMVWTNVSDLNYWRNEAAVLYGVKSVPANFLIDPSGKIIARNLGGEDLEMVLAKLIK